MKKREFEHEDGDTITLLTKDNEWGEFFEEVVEETVTSDHSDSPDDTDIFDGSNPFD